MAAARYEIVVRGRLGSTFMIKANHSPGVMWRGARDAMVVSYDER